MTVEQIERMVEVQICDVAEMQLIYEAAARGKNAAEACEEVLGGHFSLSPHAASGIEVGSNIIKLILQSSKSVDHLCLLHKYLNSGCVLEAGEDWLRGEIASLEKDLGLEPFELLALDRFDQPMSWERNGRVIHEDEMADYKEQEVELMIEQIGRISGFTNDPEIEEDTGGNANVRS
ncbi:hypothetical protein [Bacillus sp. 3255]|uniref:hypothetical protein n=1 Tax=Bacillus sp. 3255 TaxID=2817904 RepID=UPI0028617B5F|nr:hypothetical protein [Bacillus sp. 3255]MDR6884872.1 hypothetical protein [Bacillus sp. 3255]